MLPRPRDAARAAPPVVPQDRPSGVQLRLEALAKGRGENARNVTNVQRVLAALAAGSSADTEALVEATGLTRHQVYTARHHAIGSVGARGGDRRSKKRRAQRRSGLSTRVLAAIQGGAPEDRDALAGHLGEDPIAVGHALKYLRQTERIGEPRPRRVLPLVEGFMGPGAGIRRENCARYLECLDAFARAHISGQAHCPLACEQHVEADRRAEFLHLAASRPGAEHVA